MAKFLKTLVFIYKSAFSFLCLCRSWAPSVCGVIFLGFVLTYLTTERNLKQQSPDLVTPAGIVQKKLIANSEWSIASINKQPTVPAKRLDDEDSIWCQVRDYVDLSSHPSITAFQNWVDEFDLFACLQETEACPDHDPRFVRQWLQRGEKLARERRSTFEKIIRGDPKRAIELAISDDVIERLPPQIQGHLEKWESAMIDITAMNVCYDPSHPSLIVRNAHFGKERNLRLWSFGKRKNIKTVRGIAVWGVSLGRDFAMSDQPYKVSQTNETLGTVLLGGQAIPFSNSAQKEWIALNITKAERRGILGDGKISYPIAMGSDGVTITQDKYLLRQAATFAEAYQDSIDQNGSLLVIENEEEHYEVLTFLRSKLNTDLGRTGTTSQETNASLVWLGLTDDDEQNGTKYATETGTQVLEINATEGNWTWMNGNRLEDGFINWREGFPSNATTAHNYAALEWNVSDVRNFQGNDTNGTWVDINQSEHKLRYVIEFELPETQSIQVSLKGFRKFLVIPARWIDETDHFKSHLGGGNDPLVNYLGEPINDQIHADPFDAMTRQNLEETMNLVSEFYARNLDNELELTPVITSTVTLPFYKATSDGTEGSAEPTIFDTDGNFTDYKPLNINQEYSLIGEVAGTALKLAGQESERWDINGPAFFGIADLRITSSNGLVSGGYDSPPSVTIEGGAFINPETLAPHPHFKAAEAEVVLNDDGNITAIKLLSPGEYYFDPNLGMGLDNRNPPDSLALTIFDWNYLGDPNSPHNIYLELCKHLDSDGDGLAEWPKPEVVINGDNQYDPNFSLDELSVANLCVTYVCLTTGDAGGVGGLGTLGGMGSWVNINSGMSAPGLTIHEMGHNFGLNHSQRYVSYSEKAASDEGLKIDYGNPYSVMGDADYGDFTILQKYYLNRRLGAGYRVSTKLGADIANTTGSTTAQALEEGEGRPDNTFRIYRSDYHSPPRFLREGNYTLVLPAFESALLKHYVNNGGIMLSISGTGEEANGTIRLPNSQAQPILEITGGGRGFVEQPHIVALDENGTEVLTINASWIQVSNGKGNNLTQADLLDYSDEARWIRGIFTPTPATFDLAFDLQPSSLAPDGLFLADQLVDYYVSYRSDVSEHGVSLLMSTSILGDYLEGFLLDATPQTPSVLSDTPLLLGNTYSDYSADRHFTPIRKGGSEVMPWIEVVVHHNTVESGEAKAPQFNFSVSNTAPKTNEYIQFSAMVNDGNTTEYAYAWFINEQSVDDITVLNQPSIYKSFTQPGKYVVRVVVSDMRGGISSRNLEVIVDGEEIQNLSTVSGTVRSSQGSVQGARVLIDKAPLIEHRVSVVGDLQHSFFTNGKDEPIRFQIDGMTSPDLFLRRGEVHRFHFDYTTRNYPLTFLAEAENAPPRVHVNMVSDPRPDLEKGAQYFRNPQITYKVNSTYGSYLSETVGDYYTMLTFLSEQNGSFAIEESNGTHLKALQYLDEQNISSFANANLITRPYARAIMQESNISSGRVGPTSFGETGYITYGGKGYGLINIPTVKVRRSSIWEDYNKTDANATAKVDGVNTISPVLADEFLGASWETRSVDSPIPSLVVWGSGGASPDDPDSEVNATVDGWTTEEGDPMRTINVLNQGKGFEPNSTMAVLHYPIGPFAYWSFDRHETLFEDNTTARYQPSPAWNREIYRSQLVHYFKFDENFSGGVQDEIDPTFHLEGNVTGGFTESDFESWGLLGKSILLEQAEINATNTLSSSDLNFTLSLWVKPEGDYNISFTDSSVDTDAFFISFDAGPGEYSIDDGVGGNTQIPKNKNGWTHLAVVNGGDTTILYIDGYSLTATTDEIGIPDISISTESRLYLDEWRLYQTDLEEASIRYLSGISFLDISGNKRHASPMGENSFLSAPDRNMSSDDVPADDPFLNSEHGSGVLGDSYLNEDNGKSAIFNGASQYLDLDSHIQEFGLAEGSISVWIKPDFQDTAPIFSLGSAYETIDNNGTAELSASGAIFSLELFAGYPRLGGFRTIGANSIPTAEWSHLVATFPLIQFWINGVEAPAEIITTGNTEFEEASDLLDLSITAEFFRVGYSFDRYALSQSDSLPASPPLAYFRGGIDDLIIYDRPLTTEEVTFLYELRRGREEIPRLEAVVDAVGTIEIHEGGEGYRENPDLIFWYGEEENESDLENTYTTLAMLEANRTEDNTSLGMFAYVMEDDSVYSFHKGKEADRNYSWRTGAAENGWRKLIPAYGIGEFEDASLGDVVWSKKMDDLVDVPMPDGRLRTQRFVDYVTMDINYSRPLELNSSLDSTYNYYKPKGLYGFTERVEFNVTSPTEFNPGALSGNTAEAFAFFFLDHESNDSITIIDSGEGMDSLLVSQVEVFGPGYRPKGIGGEEEEWTDAYIDTHTEVTDPVITSIFGGFTHYDWNGTHDIHLEPLGSEIEDKLSAIALENPGFGYSMPCEVKVLGGFPQFTNYLYSDLNTTYANQITDANQTGISYDFREANITVSQIDSNGSILDFTISDGGHGYVPYWHLDKTSEFALWPEPLAGNHPHGGQKLHQLGYPLVLVTGGGGHGAIFLADINATGSITDIIAATDKYGNELRGRGYFNFQAGNAPKATIPSVPAVSSKKEPSIKVRLGGYLKEIPPCTACQSGTHSASPTRYSHLEPWVEIWDRGRTEAEIDSEGLRAHGAPKVVNGRITKVVVTKSGGGYIDPVAVVRDVAPKNGIYNDNGVFRRKWICHFNRLTKAGQKEICGHVHWGYYPPEECPGETDDDLPYEDENGTIIYATGDQIQGWRKRHDAENVREHFHCLAEENSSLREAHLSANFVTRKCWGTKFTYILDENGSYYRNPRRDWLSIDANLTVVTEKGKIREIIVDNPETNANYFASQIIVQGTGSEVDAIPVFDDAGINTQVIFDDPRLKNLEFDIIDRPYGAGQGFRERPWSWDSSVEDPYSTPGGTPMETSSFEPKFPYPDKVRVWAHHSEVAPGIQIMANPYGVTDMFPVWSWNFGDPVLADSLGERISEIEVLDGGTFTGRRDTNASVVIDFNDTVIITDQNDQNISTILDLDRDGQNDFQEANATAYFNSFLTSFLLDANGTYEENSSGTIIERGLFLEDPRVYILDGQALKSVVGSTKLPDAPDAYDAFAYPEEELAEFIRLNEFQEGWEGKGTFAQHGLLKYDAEADKAYVDLFVDDRFPDQFYYGYGKITLNDDLTDAVLPRAGGKIYVSESVPGLSWGVNEPRTKKKQYSYTDVNGYYALPNLEPGLYNMAVFMEDKQLQESTFRPTDNLYRVSQLLYVPGFPELLLETDNAGQGISSLVWSEQARSLSRPSNPKSTETDEYNQEFRLGKRLEGVGRGFDPNAPVPHLIFEPGIDNISRQPPNIKVEVLIDGSLSLRIVDDVNTSKYFPHDRFLVRYSSSISGVDFVESFLYSESNMTIGSGSLGSGTVGEPHLTIFPGDSNGTNAIEGPLSSLSNGDIPFKLRAQVHEANGSIYGNAQIDWAIYFDFNSSEGNNTRIAQLEGYNAPLQPDGKRELNATGDQVDLYLYSTLRRLYGTVKGFEILTGGFGYNESDVVTLESVSGYGLDANVTRVDTNGSIEEITVQKGGFIFSVDDEVKVYSAMGSGAVLRPVFYDGYLTIEANSTVADGTPVSSEAKIRASLRDMLTNQERWLDQYLDSFMEQNVSWWQEDLNNSILHEDLDDDNLTNFREWLYGSNPLQPDTDDDNLTDNQEVELTFGSSPVLVDTDRDGLSDFYEWNRTTRTNPRNQDSDGDGLLDGEDKNPDDPNVVGVISGRIFVSNKYSSAFKNTYYRFAESNETAGWNATAGWKRTWLGSPQFFYEEGLFYDRNYTIQVYLELNDASGVADYDEGEPFVEHNVTLLANEYGIPLVPEDLVPELRIPPLAQFNKTIEITETNQTNAFVWEVNATDPYYTDSTWTMNDPPSDRGIIIDGNFTEYLTGLPKSGYDYNNSSLIDIEGIPPGLYTLYYQAFDSFSNYSETAEQNITIIDRQPPFLTLIDFSLNLGITTEENASISQIYPDYQGVDFTFLEQQNTSVDLNWSIGTPFIPANMFIEARDNKSGEVSWSLTHEGKSFDSLERDAPAKLDLNLTAEDEAGNISSLIIALSFQDNQAPVLTLSGPSIDSNNSLEVYRGRGFYLEDEVQVFADDSYENYVSEILNYENNQSLFNEIKWSELGLTNTQEEGKMLIMPGEENNYTITFSYTDDSNNTGFALLHLEVKEPAWTIAGKAIDGYLMGSRVSFLSSASGPTAKTDENGSFTLFFTDEELDEFDDNQNGRLDGEEGLIVVSGGIDIDTNASFMGQLRADAESNIVSPLTSIVYSMVQDGIRFEDAQSRVLTALNLNPDIQLRSFDPIAEIVSGNPLAQAVLLANLRLANVVNISETILSASADSTYQTGDASVALYRQLASNLKSTSGEIILQEFIETAMPKVFDSLGLSESFSELEQAAIAGIILKADPQNGLESALPLHEAYEALVGTQLWLKENIFDSVNVMIEDKLTLSESDILFLEDTTDPISTSLVSQIISQRRSNHFNPHAENFSAPLNSLQLAEDCIWFIESTDADGDTVKQSLISGNIDLDGDGNFALKLMPDGRLCVADYDDLHLMAGSSVRLEVQLDDQRGRTSRVTGSVQIKNLLALQSLQMGNSWFQSDWLGVFYSGEGSWVYHHPIGWLYVHPDGQGGFWFWDHKWNLWWWSEKQAFPWIYRDESTQWDYLKIMPEGINIFDLRNRRWRRRE